MVMLAWLRLLDRAPITIQTVRQREPLSSSRVRESQAKLCICFNAVLIVGHAGLTQEEAYSHYGAWFGLVCRDRLHLQQA